MKKVFTLVGLFVLSAFLASPALAGDGKTELSVVGQGVNLKDGPTLYEVAGEVLFPIGSGHIVLGPAVVLSDEDLLTRFGLGLDWNLTGQKGGLFVGASGYYFLKDVDEVDAWTSVARVGLKLPLGDGALLKVYASEPVGGRFRDIADISYNVGITAKF